MGNAVSSPQVSPEARRIFREKVRLCLEVFERMLLTGAFETQSPRTGMELEIHLIRSSDQNPAMVNTAVLQELNNSTFTTELAQFTIELNVPSRPIDGNSWADLHDELQRTVGRVQQSAGNHAAEPALIGTLPTAMQEVFDGAWISTPTRYKALDDAIMMRRGEDLHIDIEGTEAVSFYSPTIGPEAVCASMQLHLQVSPRDFAQYWNAAQLLAGPQVALGANSPYFLGRELWHESRIEIFKQATDTRQPELRNQGVRPRVFFGERWITSVFDLFEENSQYFPSLLIEVSDEDPVRLIEQGQAPCLSELRLHNGTVYRWNRPVYDVVDGKPHLRVENRVLPAGPTLVDTIANSLFYFGAVRSLALAARPVWSKLSFSAAEENFRECAVVGLEGQVYWPGLGEVSAEEVIVRRLLPAAHDGLRAWGVNDAVREKYLGIIEDRAHSGQTGATWQTAAVKTLESAHGLSRKAALRTMLRQYQVHSNADDPVHTWPAMTAPAAMPRQRAAFDDVALGTQHQ